MKNPIPLLSLALGLFLLSSTYIRNITCPCNVPEAAISAVSKVALPVPVIEKTPVAAPVVKEFVVNFNTDISKINKNKQMVELLAYIKSHPVATVDIKGHADNRGSEIYNKKLSESRADFVMNQLVGQGLKTDQIATMGLGETAPVATNDTEQGRKQNRCVVIKIMN